MSVDNKFISDFISKIKAAKIDEQKCNVLEHKLLESKDKVPVPVSIISLVKVVDFNSYDQRLIMDIWINLVEEEIDRLNSRFGSGNSGTLYLDENDKNFKYVNIQYDSFFNEIRGYERIGGKSKDTRIEKLISCYKQTKAYKVYLMNSWWIKSELDCGFSVDEIIDLEERREMYVIRQMRKHTYSQNIKNRYTELINNKELIKLLELLKLVNELQELEPRVKICTDPKYDINEEEHAILDDIETDKSIDEQGKTIYVDKYGNTVAPVDKFGMK